MNTPEGSPPPLRIIGQGLAGSMLAWACERAGLPFRVYDPGHASSASQVGAGLVSPLAGRRLAPTWRFAEWTEAARAVYAELERALDEPLVRDLRVRRVYRDEAERARWAPRLADPEAASWVESVDTDGCWLRGAWQVETGRLIARLRERWRARGWLVEKAWVPQPAAGAGREEDGGRTVWCTGAAVVERAGAGKVPWQVSRGELLAGRLEGLEAGVVRNDGRWVLPDGAGGVRVGAIFDRMDLAAGVTAAGQAELQAAARRLTGRDVTEPVGLAGLRVTVPDHRPVAGWWDVGRRDGVLAGLAAKGALWAPVLAAQWVEDGLRGERIDPEARVGRFD